MVSKITWLCFLIDIYSNVTNFKDQLLILKNIPLNEVRDGDKAAEIF
jgi:hypothetical protein